MSNDVFANGREISCKKADGKTICEFPDVCFTPPENPATPPGVPVPYPNTAFAKDTTDGSKNVKISGQEVMLKNKSYFKTSTGDEAGAAAKKGVITSTNKGKAYFIGWSMDVKVEGENVVRHLDQTTNNHASPMATGSAPMVHADSQAPPSTDEKCKLTPYKDGCSGKKTPHHCVPDHCFKEKSEGAYYPGAIEHADGLCICVEGATKSSTPTGDHVRKADFSSSEDHIAALAEHGRIHNKFDKLERELGDKGNPKNTASLGDLEDKAAEAISEVTGCDKDNLKKQMREHHKNLPESTKLRADPYGRRQNPPRAGMGSNATAGGAPGG